jgi:hypothetical protein
LTLKPLDDITFWFYFTDKRENKMSNAKTNATPKEWISYPLDGSDLLRFQRFKSKNNLRNNAEIGRKALFDLLDRWESEQTKIEALHQNA